MADGIVWTVELSTKAKKQRKELSEKVRARFDYLVTQMERDGPIQKNRPHFSDLGKDIYHCHIKTGRPTYVAVWNVNKKEKFIEVTYVGTHEKAPY